MKKNILSYIVAGIFVFFIVYFGASLIIDHINENNSTDEGGSPSIGNDPSVEITEIKYTFYRIQLYYGPNDKWMAMAGLMNL